MATIDVVDAHNATITVQQPLAPGQGSMANSRPVVIASDQSPLPMGIGSLDHTIGTGGSNTQRISIDTSQVLAPGPNTASSSAPVTLPTDSAAIGITVAGSTNITSAYTANREVCGLFTFSGAGRSPNNSGVITDATLNFKTGLLTSEFDLFLFNANPNSSTWTDNVAPAINVADFNKLIGVIKFTKNYSGLGTHTMYKPDETTFSPIPFSGTAVYGVLTTIGTPTLSTTSDVSITLGIV